MLGSAPTGFGRYLFRFFLANVPGVGIDLVVAFLLLKIFAFKAVSAAGISVFVAAAVMYFIHEYWTFSSTRKGVSVRRLILVIVSALAALLVRYGTISALEKLASDLPYSPYLFIFVATGLSFLTNYFLIHSIFHRQRDCKLRDETCQTL